MKKSPLLIGFMMVSLCCSAQLSFGVKAGVNVNDLAFFNVPEQYKQETDMNIGFHLGASMQVNITEKFSILPEIVFTKRGCNFSDNPNDGLDRINLNYIELPILASYSFGKLISVDLGPTFAYKISTTGVSDGSRNKILFGFDKNFELGVSAGVRAHASKNLSFVARYHAGLIPVEQASFRDEQNNDLGEASGYNRNIELGLVYNIKSFD